MIWMQGKDQTAFVEEYFETLEPVAGNDTRTVMRHRHRLSLAAKWNGEWKIVRKITLAERDP